MACVNDAPPLELAWSNVTVSESGRALSRGIELGIGTPPQVFSLRPAINNDNTWVFNIAGCGSKANDSCIGFQGGAYDPQNSSTYRLSTKNAWNGTHGTDIEFDSHLYFNDDIIFGSNGSVLGYPMFMEGAGT